MSSTFGTTGPLTGGSTVTVSTRVWKRPKLSRNTRAGTSNL